MPQGVKLAAWGGFEVSFGSACWEYGEDGPKS